ncbi:hypothetical protein ACFPU1_11870 [Thalassorhabdus alkalitolerans]|uniref:Uncharacterized protein n=1 Tax=Thalassorhabdus alkalitolerans TaxID=2282697 RepID=A0ABW0YQT3_9BACI|nr:MULTISPECIES: hypothetical protein [Bacillaceae]
MAEQNKKAASESDAKVFREDKDKQMERDQSTMPVDELPLEEQKIEEEDHRKKDKTKDTSATEKKYRPY